MKNTFLIAKPPTEVADIWEITDLIAARLRRTLAILLVTKSGVHIGVELDGRVVLRRARELVKTLGVFRLTSDNCQDGVVADYYNIGYGGDTEYSLAGWGALADAAEETRPS